MQWNCAKRYTNKTDLTWTEVQHKFIIELLNKDKKANNYIQSINQQIIHFLKSERELLQCFKIVRILQPYENVKKNISKFCGLYKKLYILF